MKESIPPYVDGWFGSERELTVIPIPEFPFQKNPTPDTYSRSYKRIYEVTPRVFLPKIANRTAWTNLLKYSEDQTNVAWTKTNVTATANAVVAPDGQTTMGKLLETSATGAHSISQAATTAAAATEASVFLKNGLSRSWVQLLFTDSAATVFSAFFNVDSGYVGTKSAGVTALVVPLGNGHFQCVLRFTPAAGAGTWAAKLSTDGATTSYAGDTAKGVYLWGAQIATGTVAPYVSTTSATRAVSAPDRDPLDPMAYLVEETDPTIENSETGNTQRTFARVPNEQIVPDSLFVPLPSLTALPVGAVSVANLAVTPIGAVYQTGSTIITGNATYAPVNAGGTLTWPTSGTFTLTYKTSTTSALAYNASTGTIQSALNGLSDVIADGLTFSVTSNTMPSSVGQSYCGIIATVGGLRSAVTINGASLSPAGAQTGFSAYYPTTGQLLIGIAERATITAHGFDPTKALLLINSATGVYEILTAAQCWSVLDANTIAVMHLGSVSTMTQCGPQNGSYSVGTSVQTRVQKVTDYYLPGVTPGITTSSDIPLPTFQGDPQSILNAILAGATTLNYQVGELEQWKGAILARTIVTLNPSQL